MRELETLSQYRDEIDVSWRKAGLQFGSMSRSIWDSRLDMPQLDNFRNSCWIFRCLLSLVIRRRYPVHRKEGSLADGAGLAAPHNGGTS